MAQSLEAPAGSGRTGPVWLFGEWGGVQVWATESDRRVRATLLIQPSTQEAPVILLNSTLVGTAGEGDSITWAMALIADRGPGFYVLRDDEDNS